MTSTNYQISWDSLNSGGIDASTSTNYSVRDTIGGFITGDSTSTSYNVRAGYRQEASLTLTSSTLELAVSAEDTAGRVDYSAIDFAAGTVQVSATTSFAIGNYIAVVEGEDMEPLSGKVAVGKITGFSNYSLLVDKFDGATSTMAASPVVLGNYVYPLTNASIGFGTVAANTGYVRVVVTNVRCGVTNGYTVYTEATDVLRGASGLAFGSVADGLVDANEEEYGIAVTGTTANFVDDQPLNTTMLAIQTRNTLSDNIADRVAVLHKLSRTADTTADDYSQSVTYTLTANY